MTDKKRKNHGEENRGFSVVEIIYEEKRAKLFKATLRCIHNIRYKTENKLKNISFLKICLIKIHLSILIYTDDAVRIAISFFFMKISSKKKRMRFGYPLSGAFLLFKSIKPLT
ncbi:MAG: hypothetical protein IJN70_07530 [Clostridia bacterium]|nr:hypothetical protein [Clostridia bacterium]